MRFKTRVFVRVLRAVTVILFLFVHYRGIAATGSASFVWDPSLDTNVVSYVMYHGNESGNYSTRLEIGNQTNATVNGLEIGRTYFFVVTAQNGDGLESVPSNEVAHQVSGGLTIFKQSADDPPQISFFIAPEQVLQLQASGDLVNWETIFEARGSANEWIEFVDVRNRSVVFYRIKEIL